MNAYPSYKESGVKWIGAIPDHWLTSNIGRMMNLGRGRVISNIEIGDNPGEYPVYSSQTADNGVMGYLATYDFEGDYVTWTTDGANAGRVFYRTGKFNCTNVCGTMKPKNEKVYLPFIPYLLNLGTKYYVRYDINPKLMNGEMAQIEICLPPFSEQQTIVDFLDCKTTQINTLIEKKQRQIDLLHEQRTALINNAVTKGLNPEAPMKDSSVEWLGEIPRHWEPLQIKRMLLSSDYGVSSSLEDDGKFTILTMGDIQNGEIVLPNGGCLDEVLEELILDENDLLFNRTNSRSLVAKVGLFRGSKSDNISFASYLVRFRINEKALPEYVNYLLNCTAFIEWARSHALPSINQSNLNPTRYSQLSICLPPIDEQETITKHLNSVSEQTKKLIARLKKEIEYIQEYRTALISEAVTGKVDVREWKTVHE